MASRQSRSLLFRGAILALVIVSWLPGAMLAADSEGRSSSITGYFGLDEEGMPIVDRRGIMIVFDGAVEPETISAKTFVVSLQDGTFAEIVEAHVEDAYVFLRLRDELASDARPILALAEGEILEDLAGNSTNRDKLGFIQVADGIAPRLTVTLGGGSGRGTSDEGPDRLTKDFIDIRITSDEPLQGAPRVLVVCDGLSWEENEDGKSVKHDIDDFISNRNGPFSRRPQDLSGASYTCGYDANGDRVNDPIELTEYVAHSRSGEVWEYMWRNHPGEATTLQDGELVVVAYGRDRARYQRFGQTVSNWASAVADYRLERTGRGVYVLELHPGWNAISFPSRPLDPWIGEVFTHTSIQAVIGWDREVCCMSPWSLAVRRDGSWEHSPQFEPLLRVSEFDGYWVKSSDYVRQRVHLSQPVTIDVSGLPITGIPVVLQGWDFVGVIDSDGDQSEDHFGEPLKHYNDEFVLADDYLGRFALAYTWDPIDQRFERLLPEDPVIIGDGVWVYYKTSDPW